MADSKNGKRGSQETEDANRKKVKQGGQQDESYNPYLAHMYENDGTNGSEEPSANSPFHGMTKRMTTAKQAEKVEDLSDNPFTGQPHSQKYFQILRTRRELPVNKQR